jgi:serpin B
MFRNGRYPYLETKDFQVISLPYGMNSRLSMVVFLPKSTSNLAAFEQTLTPENWQQWMKQLQSRQGTIKLPRFKQEYSTELKTALSALGMGIAFDSEKATFAKLSSLPTKIDQVQHVAVIAVDEAGTEAAAATSVKIGVTSAPPPSEPFEMVVDRPFWFAIRDQKTGVVLFMGAITNPQS